MNNETDNLKDDELKDLTGIGALVGSAVMLGVILFLNWLFGIEGGKCYINPIDWRAIHIHLWQMHLFLFLFLNFIVSMPLYLLVFWLYGRVHGKKTLA